MFCNFPKVAAVLVAGVLCLYGSNAQSVCYTTTSRTVSSPSYYTVTSHYTTSCGLFGWDRCKRTRTHKRSRAEYRTLYSSQFQCCSGYRLVGSNQCEDIDECSGTNLCGPVAKCYNTPGSYQCVCPSGFTWNGLDCTDIDECSGTNLCDTVAECRNTPGSYHCTCPSGYTCTDIDECSDTNLCDPIAECHNTPGSYQCTCPSGYTGNGLNCTDIDECNNTNLCDPVAECYNTPGSYQCTCPSGYTGNGQNCADIDECSGTNLCDPVAECHNTPGSYQCTCPSGYTGNGLDCTDVDECSGANLCDPVSECHNTSGSSQCSCSSGYSGNNLNYTDIDEYSGINLCDPIAECHNTPGSYQCTCPSGYTGNGLDCTDIDECSDTNLCDPVAECHNTPGSYQCICPSGYTGNGLDCTDIDECSGTNLCDPVAECHNIPGSYQCTCPSGFNENGLNCTALIELNPIYGNMLGGTAVIIDHRIPLKPTNQISCTFEGISVDGSMINDTLIRCVSPLLSRTGFVPFTLHVDGRQLGKSQFLSISPERAHSVRFYGQDIFLCPNTTLSIEWSPEQLVPESILSTDITVDISLYIQQYSEGKFTWKTHGSLKRNSPNDGEEMVEVPSSELSCDYPGSVISFSVCPVSIKVSVSKNSNLPTSIGIWTGIAFLKSGFANCTTLRQQCKVWSDSEKMSTAPRLRTLSPCPPNQLIANFDNEYEKEDRSSIYHTNNDYEETYMRFFHPNITVCYRRNDPGSSSGQQCCYEKGVLVKGEPAGGSADSYSPKSSFNQHVIQDLVPCVLCCKPGEQLSMCKSYYEARPSGSEENYRFSIPGLV